MVRRSCASLFTLAFAIAAAPGAALAQDAAPPSDSAATPLPEQDADTSFGDIIVTANKRQERLQAVPVSVQAATSETLSNFAIDTPKEFGRISPTLNFQAADESRLFNFSIRGIGTESFSVGVEPSVSTIVDGVVYTRVGAVFDGLTDLDRVEVLNGPQGTLQGKNASAGAVVITTKAPNRDRLTGKVEFGIAEHGEYTGSAVISGPLGERVAFRLGGYYRTEDGVVTDIRSGKTVNNVESYGVRGKLLFEPVDGATFTLAGDWSHRKADCCGEPLRVPSSTGNVTAAFTGTPVGPLNRFVAFDSLQEGYQKNRGASLTGEIEVGGGRITSITAYREFRDFAIRDRDGTPAPFAGATPTQLFSATVPGITAADALSRLDNLLVNPLSFACRVSTRSTTEPVCGESPSLELSNTFSQEIRFTSDLGDKVDYIVGLFYYNALTERDLTLAGVRSNIAGNVSFPTPTTVVVNRPTAYVLADFISKVRTINTAAFANMNLRPFDKFTLSGGVRFLNEKLKWQHHKVTGPNGDHIGAATTNGANAGTPNFNTYREFSDNAVLGRITAKYEFSRDVMVYGSWAHGYKGQAVDADIFVSEAGFAESPVAPETSNSWEAGFKSQFWDRRITVNITGYKTTFSGYQTTSSGTDGSGAPVLRSAGKLFTKGIEGQISLRPVDGVNLGANFLFADNKFGDLIIGGVNLKGGDPLNAPETKFGLNGSFEMPVGTFTLNLAADYTWTSETLFTNLADANNKASVWRRPSFGVANAAINLYGPEDRFKISVYVKNLFNEHYVAGLRRISGSVGGAGAVAQALPRDFDRYFGGSVSYNF